MPDRFDRIMLIVAGIALALLLLAASLGSPPRSPTPDAYATAFPGLARLSDAQRDRWLDATRHQGIMHLP